MSDSFAHIPELAELKTLSRFVRPAICYALAFLLLALSPIPSLHAEGIDVEEQKKLVDAARWFFDRKEYSLAENALRNFLAAPGMDRTLRSRAQFLLAAMSQERGEDAEALAYLHGWLDEYPGMPDTSMVNFKIATLYRNFKAFPRAEEYFARSLSAAVASASSESSKKSIAVFQRIAVGAKWELAETRYQAEDWKRANDLFDRFIKQNPEAEDLVQASYYRKGDCAYQQGQMDEAIKEYQNALAIGPLHPFAPEAWLRLVDLFGKKKQYDQQALALKSLIWLVKEAHPKDIDYWQQRTAEILLFAVRNRPEDAQKMLLSINKNQSDPEWASTASFLKSLTGRVIDAYNSGTIKPDSKTPPTKDGKSANAASTAQEKNAVPVDKEKIPAPTVASNATAIPADVAVENSSSTSKTLPDDWEAWKKQLDETNRELEKKIHSLK